MGFLYYEEYSDQIPVGKNYKAGLSCSVAQSSSTLCNIMEFSRQEQSRSRLPFPAPGHLPDPGIEPASSALAGRCFTLEPPGKPNNVYSCYQ